MLNSFVSLLENIKTENEERKYLYHFSILFSIKDNE